MRDQGFTLTRLNSERGIALITTLLIMMLMSALLIGFTTVVMSDQRYRLIDRDRVRAFYAAHSGLEKLNVDLTTLFQANVAPTAAQVAALADTPPAIPDVTFSTNGPTKYGVTFLDQPDPSPIATGPYAGLIALKKIYRLDATARTEGGGETHLTRKVETVAIPVFQFGMFSDVDLSFHAGANFNFGGRIHSNGNLFLSQGGGATLTLPEKVTAVKEIVRQELANGVAIGVSGHTNTVNMAKAPGSFQSLLATWGSVVGGPASAENGSWPNISLSTYNGYIRNGKTGAKPLNLPLITTGGANIDLVRRAPQNEDVANPTLLGERFYSNVSLRVLLSDTANDIFVLPGVTGTPPVQLDGNWRIAPPVGYIVDATHPPIARVPSRVVVGGNLPTVQAAVATGANVTIPVTTASGALLPAAFKPPSTATEYFALTVSKNGASYSVTCRNKASGTQFTGCVTTTPPGATISPAATVSAALTNDTLVSSNLGANWASPWTSITVVDTAAFAPNTFTLNVTKGVNNYTVHCGVKTATQFTNCIPEVVPAASVTSPAVVTANVPTVDGTFPVTQNTTANWTSSASAWLSWATITVGSTMAYSPNTFWVLNGNNTNVLVTCTGFRYTNQFTGCNVTTALQAGATITSGALANAGTGSIGGFLKVELQDANKIWQDVTMEILNLGISAPNLNLTGRSCGDPTPNAVLRLQRLRENAETAGTCSYASSQVSSDYVPNVLFDAREALFRDVGPADNTLYLGGVMHYVMLDVRNLSRYFRGELGGLGATARTDNGFSVYFSDRRNDRNDVNQETGEYGFEDIINPGDAVGTPNGFRDNDAEDPNANNNLDTYGQFPNYNGLSNAVPPGALAPLDATARPWSTTVRAPYAMVNRPLFNRHALKLVNGGLGNIVAPGLTIASENPAYIHGSWNANLNDALGEPNVATSLVADAVMILSDAWNDMRSFTSPYNPGARVRSANSYYRLAIIGGKNAAFPRPAPGDPPQDFGTDGGAHNFLRMLEGGGGTVHYRGSIATFYYSRQALGVYKCCDTVYGPPTRKFYFDTDFLDPALLPPLTPVFRDTNALGFAQEVRPGR